uniref:Uncharacterized protein n=1 Tax=viral metagenome TaxID=1070528 RepID=A0A6C0CYC4_9ZZZZ
MEASPFMHKITIKNAEGGCVTSEVLSNSLETESQKKFIREQFRLLNRALGIEDSDKITHTTTDTRKAEMVNNYIKNAYELALKQ